MGFKNKWRYVHIQKKLITKSRSPTASKFTVIDDLNISEPRKGKKKKVGSLGTSSQKKKVRL